MLMGKWEVDTRRGEGSQELTIGKTRKERVNNDGAAASKPALSGRPPVAATRLLAQLRMTNPAVIAAAMTAGAAIVKTSFCSYLPRFRHCSGNPMPPMLKLRASKMLSNAATSDGIETAYTSGMRVATWEDAEQLLWGGVMSRGQRGHAPGRSQASALPWREG